MKMIEKVARIIAVKSTNGLSWDRIPDQFKNEFIEQARAAIEAMREPTKRMLEPVTNADGFFKLSDPKEAYQAMIDAALEE